MNILCYYSIHDNIQPISNRHRDPAEQTFEADRYLGGLETKTGHDMERTFKEECETLPVTTSHASQERNSHCSTPTTGEFHRSGLD